MLNIKKTVKGSILHLEIDLSQNHGPSASGKTDQVASTKGNVEFIEAPGIKVGVNVYRPKAV